MSVFSTRKKSSLNCFLSVFVAFFMGMFSLLLRGAESNETYETFTQEQFDQGLILYEAHCANCHGRELQGAVASSLKGRVFRDTWQKPGVDVDDLYYIIKTNMPPERPGLLNEEELLPILAFVLGNNGVAAGSSELIGKGEYLESIQIPTEELSGEVATYIRGDQGSVPRGAGPDLNALKNAPEDGSNWLYHTGDYAGTRYSPLSQIDKDNARNLQVVCLHQLGGEEYFQTGPLVYEGVMYLTAGPKTIAIDASNCRTLWSHTWQYRDRFWASTNRGVAIKDGYVVRGTTDGYLLSLDALDGSLLWARQVANSLEAEHFTMAPMIYEDLVLIGPAGGAYGISGWIGAFRLDDGAPVWKFHTVPGAMNNEDESWGNPLGIKIGGGAIWTPLSLDVDTETLYVAVTNPAPDFPAALRPGDNLYTNSVLALNIKSGELKWYRQLIPADDHGWDLTQVSPLYSAEINNIEYELLATVGKDGLLRVLDRNSQSILFEEAVTTRLNVEAPVTVDGTYTCPGVLGGVLWNGAALEKNEHLLITPSVNLCSTFYRARETRYIEGRDYFGGTVISDPETLAGFITAVDNRTGELVWQYQSSLPVVAAVTTTAGGLVLGGELSGDFLILDSSNGQPLYRFNTGGAIGGGVVSYAVGDQQYIAVASGRPSPSQVNGEVGAPTVIIFSLPQENAEL